MPAPGPRGDRAVPLSRPRDLSDGDIVLRLAASHPADPKRGGHTEHMRLYGGHVACGGRPAHRGRHTAPRALRLLLPQARRHGVAELWITCNPENRASRRTCELAGAAPAGIVELPPEVDMYQKRERRKCR